MIELEMMIMMFASSDHGERHVHQVCHFSPAIIVTRLKLTKKQKIIINVITNLVIIINYCRSLTKVKFSTDQVRPALGSGS